MPRTTKKTEDAKTPAVAEKKTAAAKKTAAKAETTAAPKTTRTRKTVSISLQYGGAEWNTDVLTERAIVAWAAEHSQKKTAAKDIQLYVKPEESMVYYVINGDSGSFTL
ncbi:DUF6465 family protein [Ruminococcus sp.]|uniref:DUF6465 family protein n=1 Tax=Ruminococcus sp. TaxID=41978 RepID=UPI0025DECAD3|nr:DUF6465 family protein [Ruminococcus sp.]